MSNEDQDFVKTKTKETTLFSYGNYNNNVPQHLSKEEFLALQNLCKNRDIVIQKSDKGNSVVIGWKMENLLTDVCKSGKVNFKNDGILCFAVNPEK